MRGTLIAWGGGEHVFALDIGGLRALQAKCGAGPQEVLARLSVGTWLLDDVLETVRLGLCGGGMERAEAVRLVAEVEESQGLMRLSKIALLALSAALVRDKDDPVGEDQGALNPPDAGNSAVSTEPVLPPDSPPATSTP